jgi:hypothetical protein
VYLDTAWVRKNLVIVLTVSVILTNLLLIFSPAAKKTLLIDMIQPLAATIAAAFSFMIVYRQNSDGLIGRAFTFLAAGFALYLVAEMIRSYNEIGLGIESSFASAAYALWLIGYGPFFYFIFKMYHLLGASHSRTHQILVSITGLAFLTFFISLALLTAELSTQEGIASFLIPVTYLVLDIVLLIPSALILLNPVKGPLTPIPWIFSSIILLSIGDSVLAYTYNVLFMENLTWTSNLFFIASYLIAAAGLYWHNRFFIVNQKEKQIKFPRRVRS